MTVKELNTIKELRADLFYQIEAKHGAEKASKYPSIVAADEVIETYKDLIKRVDLSNRILRFLEKYAGVRPDYDPNFDNIEERFTSSDAGCLFYAAYQLDNDFPVSPFISSWESGGYTPYGSKEGRKEHDEIISQIINL